MIKKYEVEKCDFSEIGVLSIPEKIVAN